MDDSGTDRRPVDRNAGPLGQGDHPVPPPVGGTGRDYRKRQRSDERVSRPDEKHLSPPSNGGELSRRSRQHIRPANRSINEVQPDSGQQESRTGLIADKSLR